MMHKVVVATLVLLAGTSVALPGEGADARRKTPRAAVAFSPDGKTLAVAGYLEVSLVDPVGGRTLAVLSGHEGPVTGLAFSPKGDRLAACGGVPGRSGEIRIWDVASRQARSMPALHTDVVYGVVWSPDGRTLAACSYDRLVSLWDVAAGKGRPLKDHTDAVYSVAFAPDGTRIASASGDRTVKIWDVASGKRLFTLSDATAELYAVAFDPSGKQIAAGGVDRMLRKWSITPTGGTLIRSAFAHEGPIVRLLYTPDGNRLYTSSEDRSIKLWDGTTLHEERVLEKQSDWAMALSLSPDERRLAVSRYDGSVTVYDADTGARKINWPHRSSKSVEAP